LKFENLEIDCIHYDYHDENEEDLRGLDQIEVIFDHCEEEEKKKEIMEGNQENEDNIDQNTMEYLLDKYMEYCLDDYPEDQIQTTQEESYHIVEKEAATKMLKGLKELIIITTTMMMKSLLLSFLMMSRSISSYYQNHKRDLEGPTQNQHNNNFKTKLFTSK
jgi:hypothetical protein